MEYLSHSPAQTEEIGEALGKQLKSGSVVAYRGGLGMGKTAFTRGLARGLGCTGRVTSPTFTIVNEYGGTLPLFHFDMYRLDSSDALFDIGWEDYLERGGVCAVEWSENVADALPDDSDERKPYSHGRHTRERLQRHDERVRRHRRRAENGNGALYYELSELEHRVFNTGRYADREHLTAKLQVKPHFQEASHTYVRVRL